MALHEDDLMVVQKHDGANEIRKATIKQLSDHLQTTNSVNYEGLRNFSQAGEEPGTRFKGDLYINNGPADGAFAWPAGNGQGITVVNLATEQSGIKMRVIGISSKVAQVMLE